MPVRSSLAVPSPSTSTHWSSRLMADIGTTAELRLRRGEDFIAQFYLTGDDDNLVKLTQPIRAQVRDGAGSLVLDFAPGQDQDTQPNIIFVGSTGFIQLSCPRVVINEIPLGRYVFDLFATIDDVSSVWAAGQQVQLLSGDVTVTGRVTIIEVPPATTGTGGTGE